MTEEQEQQIFTLIMHAGDARQKAFLAMDAADEEKDGMVEALLKEAKEALQAAHAVQTKWLQQEAGGVQSEATLLTVHAQDHLMTAMSEVRLIERMLKWRKKQ